MNKFYKKLNLELDYKDWRFLNYLVHTYIPRTSDYVHPTGTFSSYKDFFLKNSANDYREQQIFKKIANLFLSGSYTNFNHVYNLSHVAIVENTLAPHIDHRTAVITIPLVNVSPICWYENIFNSKERLLANEYEYKEIESYDYSDQAVLINTSEYHGAPNNNSHRLFFQVGGFTETFSETLKRLK
jgi:hypothetical protein